jgi:pimeloyl-ACP methyl ester carboxylesterase
MDEKRLHLIYKDNPVEISFALRKGEKGNIVFIHGLGCSKGTFAGIWEIPSFDHYTILTFDLLGFGNTSRPEAISYSLEDHAEISRLIIEELGLDSITLVGHSMGGAIGLILIEKMPSKIKAFINLEGNLIGDDCFLTRQIVKYSLMEFEELVLTNGELCTTEVGFSLDFADDTFRQWVSKSDPRAFYRSSQSLVRWSDSGELLRRFIGLDIEKTYLFSESNRKMPVLGLIDHVPKLEISNAGHFMMLDNPKGFYRSLADLILKPSVDTP